MNKISKNNIINFPNDISQEEKEIEDIPPQNFDFDISTNVAMVLSKNNKKKPIELAEFLIKEIKGIWIEVE